MTNWIFTALANGPNRRNTSLTTTWDDVNQIIQSTVMPTNAFDVANKAYVDTHLGGLALSVTPPTTGQVYAYDSGSNTFIPTSFTSSTNATQLQGVNISATPPTTGNFLGYNGTDWLPETLPIPSVFSVDYNIITNTIFGTGSPLQTLLQSITIPANTLVNVGDSIIFEACGSYSIAAGDTMTFDSYFNSTLLTASPISAVSISNGVYSFKITFIVLNNNPGSSQLETLINFDNGYSYNSPQIPIAVGINLAASNTISTKVTIKSTSSKATAYFTKAIKA